MNFIKKIITSTIYSYKCILYILYTILYNIARKIRFIVSYSDSLAFEVYVLINNYK